MRIANFRRDSQTLATTSSVPLPRTFTSFPSLQGAQPWLGEPRVPVRMDSEGTEGKLALAPEPLPALTFDPLHSPPYSWGSLPGR